MAQVIPFKGFRYNASKIGDLAKVTTPPYDVISPSEQDRFYQISQYNIIRLELGKEEPEDDELNNKYTRAAAYLKDWIEKQVLVQERQPSFYIYQQEFGLPNGNKYTRTGFISLVRLEDFSKGVILPHENTLSKPKADRLRLMQACQANFSQIFALYDDPEKAIPHLLKRHIDAHSPDIEVEAIPGIIDRLWVVSDHSLIAQIQECMADKKLYIADGHHRYETALTYRNQRMAQNPYHTGDELYNFVMMMIVEMEDPGLIILPTHRIISGIEGFSKEEFLKRASKDFIVEEHALSGATLKQRADEMESLLTQKGSHSFVFYDGNLRSCYTLMLKSMESVNERLPQHHISYRSLDVTILHTLLLEPLLGIGREQMANQEFITYTHDLMEGAQWVEEGKCQMAFFVNAPSVRQVKEVSLAGEKMPQKSTYFYPKLLTGLVINKF